PLGSGEVKPWVSLSLSLEQKGPRLGPPTSGWIGDIQMLEGPQGGWRLPTLRDLETFSRTESLTLRYVSAPALVASARRSSEVAAAPALSKKSKVLALIPHFQCEEWLEGALQ